MSQSPHPPRRLRLCLAVTLALALLAYPAAHAVEIQPAGLRLSGFAEILSPLMDLFSWVWEKEGGGLDPNGSPQGEEGGGLDPDGAPAAGKKCHTILENPRLKPAALPALRASLLSSGLSVASKACQ